MKLSRTLAMLMAGDLRQVAYHVTQAREMLRGGVYVTADEHLTEALRLLRGE